MDFIQILLKSDQLFGPDGMQQIMIAGGIGGIIGLIIGRKSFLLALLLGVLFGVGAAAFWASRLYGANDRDKQRYFEHRWEATFSVEFKYTVVKDTFGNPHKVPDLSKPVTLNLYSGLTPEILETLTAARRRYGVTRFYAMAGLRGKASIPFDYLWDGSHWIVAPYEGFDQQMKQVAESGKKPLTFDEWLNRQFALYCYNAYVLREFYGTFPAGALPEEVAPFREIPPAFFTFEVYAPEPALYRENEAERLEKTARDPDELRALVDPYGRPIKFERSTYVKN